MMIRSALQTANPGSTHMLEQRPSLVNTMAKGAGLQPLVVV